MSNVKTPAKIPQLAPRVRSTSEVFREPPKLSLVDGDLHDRGSPAEKGLDRRTPLSVDTKYVYHFS